MCPPVQYTSLIYHVVLIDYEVGRRIGWLFFFRQIENLAFLWIEHHFPLVFPLCQAAQISVQVGTVGVGGSGKVGDGVISE